MRFVHLADTHLGFRQYGLSEREEDFYDAFRRITDRIIELRPDFVLHSGDLFDYPRPQPKALLVAQESFVRLKEKGIPVFAITGNHDMLMRRGSMPPQVLYKHLGLRLLDHRTPYVVRDGVFIGGCPYHSRYYSKSLIDDIRSLSKEAARHKQRILMLHQSIEKYLSFEYELRLGDLPKNFDYYAIGHIHNRVLEDFGRGKLGYPGSTELWSVDEQRDYKRNGKGFYLVELDRKELDVQKISIPLNREFLRVELDRKELDSVIKKLSAQAAKLKSKPILYLDIKNADDRSFVHELLMKELGDVSLSLKINHLLKAVEEGKPLAKGFNVQEMIREVVGDEQKASLAVMLYDLLSIGVEGQALKEIENFYGDFE